MGARPRFSIVIPAWNEAEYLPECLMSLSHQDFPGTVEIIVVDNNSSDRTAQVAKEYGATVIHEPVQGVCQARQTGTVAARGEIVVSSDADTTFAHDWLSRFDHALVAEPNLVAVCGPCHWLDAPWWGRAYERLLFGTVSWFHKRYGRVIYGSATNIAFKRSAWTGYNTNLTQGGDELDLIRRLQRAGPIRFSPDNRTFTSSRRLRKGLAYSLFVTCFYHYVLAYAVNRLAGRPVLGMAPAFRNPEDVVRYADIEDDPEAYTTHAVAPDPPEVDSQAHRGRS